MNAKLIPFNAPAPAQTDAALLSACAGGDAEALATLFDRHQGNVQRFLARTWHLDSVDLEDVLQSVFIEVHQKADTFGGRSSVSSWIFGIAVNKARHHIRSASRRRSLFEAIAEQWSAWSAPPTPETIAQSRQELQHLDAIQALPEHLRIVFVMCDLEGLGGVEAARALSLAEGTLYRRLHQARKHLKSTIKEDGS